MNGTASRVRVAFLDHCARLSGAEMALLRLLPALREVDPLVVLGEDGPLRQRLEEAGVEVLVLPLPERTATLRRHRVGRRLPLSAAVDVLGYVWRLRRLLRERGIEAVHTNSLKACLYGGLAGRLAGVPVVWHARDRYHEDYLPRPAVRLVRLAARLLPRVVIANSRTTLATLAPHPRRQPRMVVASPLAAEIRDVGRRRLDATSAAAGGPLVVGMVGRISPWKGQDVFLRAVAEAVGDGPKCAIRARVIGSALFGEDAHAAAMRQLTEELGIAHCVEWRGFREDMAAELAELDVLVHCSTTPEPFGQVVVEGMAAALAVVSTDVGGPAEVIDDGRTGLLVPPGHPGALAAVLRRLAAESDERDRLGAAAYEASAAYGVEAIAAPIDTVFRRLGDRHTGQITRTSSPVPAVRVPSRRAGRR